jgi:uncharacterized protein (TIGR03067 family)
MVGGAVLAVGLVAVGPMAAWPGEAPGQPEKPKVKVKAVEAKVQPAKPIADGPKLPDRDALQGLWVLDKFDLGKAGRGEERQAQEMIGKMRFLVAGDLWWGMMVGERDAVMPHVAKLDPAKNPKWLDLKGVGRDGWGFQRCIYELEGDKLRICIPPDGDGNRPAEFNTEDDDTPLIVMHFRREKLPHAADEKALVGSWENPFERIGVDEGKNLYQPIQRVEILDGYLFAFSMDKGRPDDWFGGKYTVDTTKNPKWIDVELVAPIGDKVTKLYGCYEVADGRLKMALGVKRALRPLEFKSVSGVMLFDLKPTKEPLAPAEKVVVGGATLPSPQYLDTPKAAKTPKSPSSPSKAPRPKAEDRPVTNPVPSAPVPPATAPTPRPTDKPAPTSIPKAP